VNVDSVAGVSEAHAVSTIRNEGSNCILIIEFAVGDWLQFGSTRDMEILVKFVSRPLPFLALYGALFAVVP
jgi:hypothetical protein